MSGERREGEQESRREERRRTGEGREGEQKSSREGEKERRREGEKERGHMGCSEKGGIQSQATWCQTGARHYGVRNATQGLLLLLLWVRNAGPQARLPPSVRARNRSTPLVT